MQNKEEKKVVMSVDSLEDIIDDDLDTEGDFIRQEVKEASKESQSWLWSIYDSWIGSTELAAVPKKEKKVIFFYLLEVVEKLVTQIALGSFVSAMEKAKKDYEAPLNSRLGYFYAWFRTRGPELSKVLEEQPKISDSVLRVKSFQSLISNGEWNDGSFNDNLFDQLLDNLSEYESLSKVSKEIRLFIISRIKDLINERIDHFVHDHEEHLKSVAKKNQALRQVENSSERKVIQKVLLEPDLEKAKELAAKDKNNLYFSFAKRGSSWDLFWIDFFGKGYELKLEDADLLDKPVQNLKELEVWNETLERYNLKLKDSSSYQPVQNLRELMALGEKLKKCESLSDKAILELKEGARNLINLKLWEESIKKACKKAMHSLFATLRVELNPKETNDKLPKGLVSTFIVRQLPEKNLLFWVNGFGGIREISLDKYAALNTCLKELGPRSDDVLLYQLKTHLFYVDTSKLIPVSVTNRLQWLLKPPAPTKEVFVVKKLDMSQHEALNTSLALFFAPKKLEFAPKKLDKNRCQELAARLTGQ